MWQYDDELFPNRQYTYFQFGLQRTGTTVIDRVIKDTWGYWKANDAFPNDIQVRPPAYHKYVWKHSIDFPDQFEKGAPVVLVYKNPYTWAESMAFRKVPATEVGVLLTGMKLTNICIHNLTIGIRSQYLAKALQTLARSCTYINIGLIHG